MSLLEKLQSKWGRGDVTVMTVATVDLFQKPCVAKVASVASSRDEGNTQPKLLIGFDPSDDGDPLLEILLDLGNEICKFISSQERLA